MNSELRDGLKPLRPPSSTYTNYNGNLLLNSLQFAIPNIAMVTCPCPGSDVILLLLMCRNILLLCITIDIYIEREIDRIRSTNKSTSLKAISALKSFQGVICTMHMPTLQCARSINTIVKLKKIFLYAAAFCFPRSLVGFFSHLLRNIICGTKSLGKI